MAEAGDAKKKQPEGRITVDLAGQVALVTGASQGLGRGPSPTESRARCQSATVSSTPSLASGRGWCTAIPPASSWAVAAASGSVPSVFQENGTGAASAVRPGPVADVLSTRAIRPVQARGVPPPQRIRMLTGRCASPSPAASSARGTAAGSSAATRATDAARRGRDGMAQSGREPIPGQGRGADGSDRRTRRQSVFGP